MTNFKKSDVIIASPKKLRIEGDHNYSDQTLIGAQIKPRQNLSMAKDVIGLEVMPGLNSAIALTGAGSLIGQDISLVLKGTSGNIAGDIRGLQLSVDSSPGRTISGYATYIRIRDDFQGTLTGRHSAIRLEQGTDPSTVALNYFLDFGAGVSCVVAAAVGGSQDQKIRVSLNGTDYYIPLHTT